MVIPHDHANVLSCFLLIGMFTEIVILVLWVSVYQTPLLTEVIECGVFALTTIALTRISFSLKTMFAVIEASPMADI
jgi:hypothetical protein